MTLRKLVFEQWRVEQLAYIAWSVAVASAVYLALYRLHAIGGGYDY